ncbi:MAG: ribosomal-processing cysteine protease Prp [Clostridia bacterium]|nr:ribosomal-processing cysteine protease Prp [Clostridia bacterium]
MTNIKVFKQESNILGFEVSGHSGYAEAGSDIVCSAISTLAQSTCVGLDNVLNLRPCIKVDDKNAYLKCVLPKNLTNEQNTQAQILLKTFYESVKLLLAGDKKLKKYISLEVKNAI